MGHIELPPQGKVYVDSNIIIYTVETNPYYAPLLEPLWNASEKGALNVYCSELSIVEVLTAPLKYGDALLTRAYTRALFETEIRLVPITREILLSAAQIRATQPSVRTPDAIHFATALLHECDMFITNDKQFQLLQGLPVIILDNLLST